MNEKEITELARQIRLETLKSLTQLGFGHYGGSMSVVETLAVLYGAVMKIDPADPDWPERDYLSCRKAMRARRSTARWRSRATSRWKS
jgi:transketolase